MTVGYFELVHLDEHISGATLSESTMYGTQPTVLLNSPPVGKPYNIACL